MVPVESSMDGMTDFSFLRHRRFARYLLALLLYLKFSYLSCWIRNCVFFVYDTFELCLKFSQLILYLFTGVVGVLVC